MYPLKPNPFAGANSALHRLVMLLDEFRKVNPEMPMQQAVTLLTIALEPGLSISDLGKKAGNTLASTSRHVELLGPWNPVKKRGLDYVAYPVDLADRRRTLVVLTPKGERTIRTLLDILNR